MPVLTEKIKIGKVGKLVPNLKDKKGYVIHIKNMNQILKQGVTLKKVHRVIRFKQSYWMKTYIMLNTELRTAAANEFVKDFFKLINALQRFCKGYRKY